MKLAKVVERVHQDAVARRDPVQQLEITTQDVNAALEFFEETLQMDVSRSYLRDLFYDLKHRVQMRELTIGAVEDLNGELATIANNTADALTVVTEALDDEKIKNRELRAELREASAIEAAEFDRGQNAVVWIWAELIAEERGTPVHEAYESIIRHIAQKAAEETDDE